MSESSMGVSTGSTSKARPKDPRMGSTEETYVGSNVFYYAFGGAPLPDWSGIKDPSSRLLSDLCYRSLDPVSGQKSTLYRTKGLSKPYDRSQKLSDFQKKVWDHLVNYGLDTIGYLQDPKDPTKVQSVVQYHARFNGDLSKALAVSKVWKEKFDSWDKKHDFEARQFLLNSLSDEVKSGFETFHERDDTFAATWLKLIHYLVTTTSKTYDEMKQTIRSKRPQQYAGQNIEAMAIDLIQIAKEVDNAGYYSHSLTLNMVDSFLCASKDPKGTFHHSMNSLRERVSAKEQETVFLSSDDQDKQFAAAKLSYKDVCLHAVKIYNELVSINMWEPSKLPKDRQTPPTINLSTAEIMNLIQSTVNKNKEQGRGRFNRGCFNCGDTDHQVKDCPKPRPTDEQARARRHSGMSQWKLTPPKSGEPHSKVVNGRTFNWCVKCGNWTTTHDSNSHTGGTKQQEKKPNPIAAESNLAAWDPSAWIVEANVNSEPPSISVLSVLWYFYLVLSVGFLIGLPIPNLINIYHQRGVIWSLVIEQYSMHSWLISVCVAPLCWFMLGFGCCYLSSTNTSTLLSTNDLLLQTRKHRNRLQRQLHRTRKKLKSARDHSLCASYPLRLRNDNIFNTRSSTPTILERELYALLDRHASNVHHRQRNPTWHYRKFHSRRDPKYASNKKGGKVKGMHHHHNSSSTSSFSQPTPNHRHCCSSCSSTRGHHKHQCKHHSKYKPKGVRTIRTTPNLNYTSKQHYSVRSATHNMCLLGAHLTDTMATKVVSLAPSVFRSAISSRDQNKSFPIIWDSGASVCITPDKSDFVTYNNDADITKVKGLGGKVSAIIGQGEVDWSIHDVHGCLRHLRLKAYHIPKCSTRLISTNVLLNTYKGEQVTIDAFSLRLSGIENDSERSPVLVFNNPSSNLPTTTAYRSADTVDPPDMLCHTVSTVHDHNRNLSEAEKELLRWHQRLGHLAFKKIQHLMRTGILSNVESTRNLHTAASKVKSPPKCAACLFGKQTARPSPGTITTVVQDRAGVLRAGNLLPGSEVSVDHFVSSVKGRLFSGYDKGSDDSRYVGGCIFVDHASSYIHVECQPSLSSHETLRAKMSFERHCRDVGVVVLKYMSDNGTAFTSKDYTEHLSSFQQVTKFAGVGAHHHNAQAERAIRTIMSISRTMMMHAGIHWPDMAQSSLWPMAVVHSCFLFNHVPSPSTGLSPADIFSKTRWPQKRFHDLHVWGCPVYVLDKSIQDGKKIPKWQPRSHRSVYMGVSPSHATSVPLVLNTSTGAITPQYHVVFDDWFATVPGDGSEMPDFSEDEWAKMFGSSRFQYVLDNSEEALDDSHSDAQETDDFNRNVDAVGMAQDQINPTVPLPVSQPSTLPSPSLHDSPNVSSPGGSGSKGGEFSGLPTPQVDSSTTPVQPPHLIDPSITPKEVPSTSTPSLSSPPVRRSRRTSNPVQRLTYDHNSKSNKYSTDVSLACLIDAEHVYPTLPDAIVLVASKTKDHPDLFTYEEAMNSEHKQEWMESAAKEIKSLEDLGCWEEISLEEATAKVLPGTWVFKVKRAPDGSFKKFKARYCIRGDLQEGDFETYAPVVSFSSVRLFLAWSLMMNWYTICIDFSNAFIQATLEEPTFIHLPRGFSSSKGHKSCLRLKKSIYGLSVAPRLWFQHLLTALKDEGLVQSKHDPCLMYRSDCMVICYVDDLGLQVPRKEIADTLISSLEAKGFSLTREGSFSEYLGIQYERSSDNRSINMTQTGLIQKILDATGMQDCNPNRTPATREALGSDVNGEPMEDSWNYRSVIGMLLYLSTNTRPDIAYAVSQVARFSHSPKKSHASAVKTVIRYLSGTKDKGLVYKRPETFTLDCYVDADFAGLYGKEAPEDPVGVKSRTGYTISVGGCFVLCKSQLQSTIALSTSEAEYGALSQAMRAVIPIRETMLEIIEVVDMIDSEGVRPFGNKADLSQFRTRVYEDNSSALALANKQKVTSRTKHWCVKFHFFWSHINDKTKNMDCLKVETKEQRADYLTKGLTKDAFEHCRNLNQGW
jgi:hypothetical protein